MVKSIRLTEIPVHKHIFLCLCGDVVIFYPFIELIFARILVSRRKTECFKAGNKVFQGGKLFVSRYETECFNRVKRFVSLE